jgi:hypothetical protein
MNGHWSAHRSRHQKHQRDPKQRQQDSKRTEFHRAPPLGPDNIERARLSIYPAIPWPGCACEGISIANLQSGTMKNGSSRRSIQPPCRPCASTTGMRVGNRARSTCPRASTHPGVGGKRSRWTSRSSRIHPPRPSPSAAKPTPNIQRRNAEGIGTLIGTLIATSNCLHIHCGIPSDPCQYPFCQLIRGDPCSPSSFPQRIRFLPPWEGHPRIRN